MLGQFTYLDKDAKKLTNGHRLHPSEREAIERRLKLRELYLLASPSLQEEIECRIILGNVNGHAGLYECDLGLLHDTKYRVREELMLAGKELPPVFSLPKSRHVVLQEERKKREADALAKKEAEAHELADNEKYFAELEKAEWVPMVDPDGKTHEVHADDVAKALKKGWTLAA